MASIAEIALGLIPGVGAQTSRLLISHIGSAENVLKTPKGRLLKIPGIGEKIAQAICRNNVYQEAETLYDRAEKENIALLFFTDKNYPDKLKGIHDAPALLYVKGNHKLSGIRSVAIVGTRKPTLYGTETTEKIVRALQEHNVTIISGMAFGIDITAHQACLKYNIPTIGIIATGIDGMYPAAHRKIADKMIQQGGSIISEYTFGTMADPSYFPARNRIIAGMADLTIVVEAASKGGALITAHLANSYHREVMAVPGTINMPTSEGCHYLIKNHLAHIYTQPDDIVKLMNWDSNSDQNKLRYVPDLTEEEMKIYNHLLIQKENHIDEISWACQIGINKVSSLLLEMEFKGIIKPLPGKKFRLIQ